MNASCMWTSGNMDAENPDAEILMDTRSLHMAAAYCTIERSWVRYNVQNFFGHLINPRFARNSELAFRGSFLFLLCAIPVIIPENVSETRDTIIRYCTASTIVRSVCCFIVFNMGKLSERPLTLQFLASKAPSLSH